MVALESELVEYQATPDDEFPTCFDEFDKSMRIDHVWHQMFKQTAKCSGQPRLKRLVEVTKFLLLISLRVIRIVRVYLIHPERSALMVATTYTRYYTRSCIY